MNIAPIKPPAFAELPDPLGAAGAQGAARARPTPSSTAATGSTAAAAPTAGQRVDNLDLGESFASALKNAHAAETTATTAAEQFARGDTGMGIHEVMIATEKANLAVRYTTTFKNKALEAYRELLNTQV
jgi:flagellar hook-basal body complex protein FliE